MLSTRRQYSFQENLENKVEDLTKRLTEIPCNSQLPNLQSYQLETCQYYIVFLFLLFFAYFLFIFTSITFFHAHSFFILI